MVEFGVGRNARVIGELDLHDSNVVFLLLILVIQSGDLRHQLVLQFVLP